MLEVSKVESVAALVLRFREAKSILYERCLSFSIGRYRNPDIQHLRRGVSALSDVLQRLRDDHEPALYV